MVTFIIGNGFDIRVGLKTKYPDFYEVYSKCQKEDSKTIIEFKDNILKDKSHGWKNWSDFELQMGKHSNEFQGKTLIEDFIECFNDFVTSFNKYLESECESIEWSAVSAADKRNFSSSIINFYKHLTQVRQDKIKKRINRRASVNFLQLNYTNAFDNMLDMKNPRLFDEVNQYEHNYIGVLGKNLHLHGVFGKGGYMTMGVDNESQIKNASMNTDSRINKIFVKPRFLDALQARNVNQDSHRAKAEHVIGNSSIICIYGASIGDTDGFWWEKVGNWLKKSQGTLIIFDTCGADDDGISPKAFLDMELSIAQRRDEITERFLRLANLENDWVTKNPDRLFVELDTKMFDFKLPRKGRTLSNTEIDKALISNEKVDKALFKEIATAIVDK